MDSAALARWRRANARHPSPRVGICPLLCCCYHQLRYARAASPTQLFYLQNGREDAAVEGGTVLLGRLIFMTSQVRAINIFCWHQGVYANAIKDYVLDANACIV